MATKSKALNKAGRRIINGKYYYRQTTGYHFAKKIDAINHIKSHKKKSSFKEIDYRIVKVAGGYAVYTNADRVDLF